MTTVTAVRRALDETIADPSIVVSSLAAMEGLRAIRNSPTAITILANHLSDRGTAGNAARAKHLAVLSSLFAIAADGHPDDGADALEWAIDQLTPPELASGLKDKPGLSWRGKPLSELTSEELADAIKQTESGHFGLSAWRELVAELSRRDLAASTDKVEALMPQASLEPPSPPWEAGAKTNAMREGWNDYWSGKSRKACPFPRNRHDLLKQYQTGWDCAKQSDGKASQSERQDVWLVRFERAGVSALFEYFSESEARLDAESGDGEYIGQDKAAFAEPLTSGKTRKRSQQVSDSLCPKCGDLEHGGPFCPNRV